MTAQIAPDGRTAAQDGRKRGSQAHVPLALSTTRQRHEALGRLPDRSRVWTLAEIKAERGAYGAGRIRIRDRWTVVPARG